ncbi:DUF3515 domain-containing protein [Arthrobacter sp. CAU 1506]|uniref:DUF3515 domain-containing protein n=1 Tax=Arthrobacter sp. CAU 1506 TaxID=2560052 RepID=UPI0010AB7730|nr:DUF3515 domain-containing protein [Arthrobacter sp. CAU 1506]TJY68836.1 DUF3515 domain-containing protein [Arthrobacter sp. CAU 1506]
MTRVFPNCRRLAALISLGLLGSLTACSPVVTVDAAPDAANPGCAPMMVILPQYVADFPRRETSSQSTAAWGDPSQVILRCGVQVPGPTTDQCVSVNDVDWVLREGENGYWTATTYGRTPATELIFKPDDVAESSVLMDLSAAASEIPQERKCLSISDVL